MVKYELSEEQIKNLSVFLGRVQLQGTEVNAFNDLLSALGKPIKEDDNKPKRK